MTNIRSALYLLLLGTLAVLLVAMPTLKYYAGRATFYDLGFYANIISQITDSARWGYLFRVHANPLMLLYGLAYSVWPTPVVLILLQSLGLLGGGWLFAALCRQVAGISRMAAWGIYLLSLPVWFSALFDFHFEHILFVLFPAIFLCAEKDSQLPRLWLKLLGSFFVVLIALTKEPHALSACMVGLVLLLRYRWGKWAWGCILISALYFSCAVGVLIPYWSGGLSISSIWTDAFGYLGETPLSAMSNLATHPWIILTEIFSTPSKLILPVVLGGALCGIPVFSPLFLLPALPPLLLAMLSRDPSHYAYGHQYSAAIAAPLLVAFPFALRKLPKRGLKAGVVATLVSSIVITAVLSPAPFSRLFLGDKIWSYEHAAYWEQPRSRKIAEAIDTYISPNSEAVVSTQNNIITKRLTNRDWLLPFPMGVFKPEKLLDWENSSWKNFSVFIRERSTGAPVKPVLADYVVLDFRRPLFVYDKGCAWTYGKCDDLVMIEQVENMREQMERNFYSLLYDYDGFYIWKRQN